MPETMSGDVSGKVCETCKTTAWSQYKSRLWGRLFAAHFCWAFLLCAFAEHFYCMFLLSIFIVCFFCAFYFVLLLRIPAEHFYCIFSCVFFAFYCCVFIAYYFLCCVIFFIPDPDIRDCPRGSSRCQSPGNCPGLFQELPRAFPGIAGGLFRELPGAFPGTAEAYSRNPAFSDPVYGFIRSFFLP